MNTSPLTDVQWDAILNGIHDEATILCIGAELFNTPETTLDRQLCEALDVANNPNIRAYPDGLFHFKDTADILSFPRIKQFWQKDFNELQATLDKIAQIRLPLVISLNYSLHLKQAFERTGLLYRYEYYFRKRKSPAIEVLSVDEPLVYNFLGDVNKRESVILTHEDLYDFLESIIEHKNMPDVLKEYIRNANNFIFLGLPIDRWYMQLLLRVLGQHLNLKKFKLAANAAFEEEISTFCCEQYNITCVPTQIESFVDELHWRCEAADLLRRTSSQPTSQPIEMVVKGQYLKALDLLEALIKKDFPHNQKSLKMVNQLRGRCNDLQDKVVAGTLAHDEENREKNKIRQAILDFITNLNS